MSDASPAILVTRPEAQARRVVPALAAQGWAPVICPVTRFRALAAEPPWEAAKGLIFTSANALRAVAPPRAALRLPVWCVGEATARAARAAGFADVRAGPGDAARLAPMILADGAEGPLLHLRGVHGTAGFSEALESGGVELLTSEVYCMDAVGTLPEEATAALRDAPAATVWSPRGARLFAGLVPAGTPPLDVAAISEAAAGALGGMAVRHLRVAPAPDAAGMLAATARLFADRDGKR